MKFEIVQSLLENRLKTVNGIIDAKSTQPILTHMLLQADAETQQARFIGTDTEISLAITAPAKVIEAGQVSVPADMFTKIISEFESDDCISCQFDGESQFTFSTGKNSFALMTLPAEDFPLATPAETFREIQIDGAALHQLLNRTAFSMADNDVRQYLNGLYLYVKEDGQNVESVTTDGHRLSTARAELLAPADSTEGSRGIIIPKKAVQFLTNYSKAENYIAALEERKAQAADVETMNAMNDLLQAAGKNYKSLPYQQQMQALSRPISLHIAERELAIIEGDYVFITRLLDGAYPAYEQIIPAENGTSVIQTDAKKLLRVLKRMLVVLGKTEKGVAMHINGGHSLKIEARNSKNENANEELDVVNAQQIACSIGLNAEYLSQVINAMDSQDLRLHITDPSTPVLITGGSDPGLRYVIMPMRL